MSNEPTMTDGAGGERLRELQGARETMAKVVRRRELFAEAFGEDKHPGLMAELEEFFGLKHVVFAFMPEADGKPDVFNAARRDALFGALRGIRYEVEHLEEAQGELKRINEELAKVGAAAGEEVRHG